METRLKLSKSSESPLVDATEYHSIVGGLRYLVTHAYPPSGQPPHRTARGRAPLTAHGASEQSTALTSRPRRRTRVPVKRGAAQQLRHDLLSLLAYKRWTLHRRAAPSPLSPSPPPLQAPPRRRQPIPHLRVKLPRQLIVFIDHRSTDTTSSEFRRDPLSAATHRRAASEPPSFLGEFAVDS